MSSIWAWRVGRGPLLHVRERCLGPICTWLIDYACVDSPTLSNMSRHPPPCFLWISRIILFFHTDSFILHMNFPFFSVGVGGPPPSGLHLFGLNLKTAMVKYACENERWKISQMLFSHRDIIMWKSLGLTEHLVAFMLRYGHNCRFENSIP